MDLGLKGKVAIVAASSKGLGRAVAAGLAREGALVTINGRNAAMVAATAAAIRAETDGDVLEHVALPSIWSRRRGGRAVAWTWLFATLGDRRRGTSPRSPTMSPGIVRWN